MEKNLYLLFDNGHGIETPGKRSPDGRFREYEWNRKVARAAVSKLQHFGYNAVHLVPEDNDIPLATRVKRANDYCARYGKDNVIFISIHVNAAGNGSEWMQGRGWSAFTTVGQTKADLVADDLYWAAEQVFPKKDLKIRYDRSDGDPDWESNFYVLKNTKCPAVLVENFFMDNKEDCEYLRSLESIKDCSEVIVNGLIAYMQNR